MYHDKPFKKGLVWLKGTFSYITFSLIRTVIFLTTCFPISKKWPCFDLQKKNLGGEKKSIAKREREQKSTSRNMIYECLPSRPFVIVKSDKKYKNQKMFLDFKYYLILTLFIHFAISEVFKYGDRKYYFNSCKCGEQRK